MRALLALPLLLACNDPKGSGSETSDMAPEEAALCSPETDWEEVKMVNTETADATASVIIPVPNNWIVEKAQEEDLGETEVAITRITSEAVYRDPANPPEGVAYVYITTYALGNVPWESTGYADGSNDPETIAEGLHSVTEADEWNTTEVSPVECLNDSGAQLCGFATTFNGNADNGEPNGSANTSLLTFGLTTGESPSSIRMVATTGEYIENISLWSGWTAALFELSKDHVFQQGTCSLYSAKVE